MKYWIKPLGAPDRNAKEIEAPPNQWVDAVQMAFPEESVFCQVTKEEVIADVEKELARIIRDKFLGFRLVDNHYPPVERTLRPKDIEHILRDMTGIKFEILIYKNRVILEEK